MTDLAFGGWSGVLIMAVYGLIMLGIGFITYLKHKGIHQSNKEYYLGGGKLSLMVLFFTFFATQYSGNTIIGYAPNAYRLGFSWLQSITFFILIIVGYLLFAPRLYSISKKYSFITPSDWLEKRFKSKGITILGSLLMLYGLCNYLLEQLVAIGQGVSGLTGGTVPYQLAVVFFVVIMLIYGWLGGMRSVAYTDTMQGIALLVGVFVLLIGSIIYFGGLPTATSYMEVYSPEKLGVPGGEAIMSWFSLLIIVAIGGAIYPHAIQRIFAASSERVLKKSLIRMAWMPFITAGFVFIIGIIGINVFPDLDVGQSEQLVGMMANELAGKNAFFYWAMVILFGGIIAAIISTADSVLLTFSSIISKDLYGRYINPNAPEKKQILVGKWIGILAVAVLLIIAWYPPATLYEIFVLKFEVLVQVAPAIILGLYWNRLHKNAVFAGMLVGTITAAVMTFANIEFLGILSGIWGLLVNLLICVVGSLVMSVSVKEEEDAKQVVGM
ncbi:SSS family transporter [Bacillus pakistanensis]|uniref:SSS family transporter n=1 Tax=Rossellomorea pakistanensis TaxID=992288 RepID=A0ABS2NCZ7_9BACI|nr:sodium:solute symporter family protein [Bacillus pakistanensis]MBM7585718.1 SSS family transporter [Bacillus pakistanensis]